MFPMVAKRSINLSQLIPSTIKRKNGELMEMLSAFTNSYKINFLYQQQKIYWQHDW